MAEETGADERTLTAIPRVAEVMSQPTQLPGETPLSEACQVMEKEHVGTVLLVSEGEPVAIVTDRDAALHAYGKGEVDATLRDCAVYPLKTIPASATLEAAAAEMRRMHLRRLAVVDEEGLVCGVVSADDLALHLSASVADLAECLRREFDHERHPPSSGSSIFGKE